MKFPRVRISLAALLVTVLALPAAAAKTPSDKSAPTAKTAKAKVKKPKKGTKAWKLDSIRVADSTRLAGMNRRLDSLKQIDSLHRADSLRVADSLRSIDSSLRVDSLRKADSLRRIDSLDRISRTWYVGRIRDFTQSPDAVAGVLEKLRVQLQRTGEIFMADRGIRDTCGGFDCSWKAATSSGAGRLVYGALYRTPDSGWKLSTWLFELPSGRKTDSAFASSPRTASKPLDDIARRTVRLLRPSASEARCTADSLAHATETWGFEIPFNRTTDTTLNGRLLGAFASEFSRTGRARSLLLPEKPFCPDRKCLDSLAKASGAQKALRFDVSKSSDSAWKLLLVASSSQDDSMIDSFLVTGTSPEILAAKATGILLPAPRSCRTPCTVPRPELSRMAWSMGRISSDSADKEAATLLAERIGAAFFRSLDHQFVPLTGSDTSRKAYDSTIVARGIQRLVEGGLSGSDSAWTFSVKLKDARTGETLDSLVLERGGWRPRVFDWFARKTLERSRPTVAGCASPCSEDSARAAATAWAFAATTNQVEDATLAKLANDDLVGSMVSRGLGKAVSFPDTLPCNHLRCLDSIANSRGAKYVVWSRLGFALDSSWKISAWVTEASTDILLDSTHQADTGTPVEALSRLAEAALDDIVPKAPRCDLCVPRDTLEAGLALLEPAWTDVIDTMQTLFLDSMRTVLAREGHFQVLPWVATDSVYSRWKGRDCDSACRAALQCRTGASSMVVSSVRRDGSGWKVSAKLVDLRTGKVLSEIATQERRNDIQRLREISPWAARKLIGTDSSAKAPSSRRFLDWPWGKIVALAIPVTAGLVSVISRW